MVTNLQCLLPIHFCFLSVKGKITGIMFTWRYTPYITEAMVTIHRTELKIQVLDQLCSSRKQSKANNGQSTKVIPPSVSSSPVLSLTIHMRAFSSILISLRFYSLKHTQHSTAAAATAVVNMAQLFLCAGQRLSLIHI